MVCEMEMMLGNGKGEVLYLGLKMYLMHVRAWPVEC